MKLDYKYVKMRIEERGYSLLSDEYINARTPLLIKCNKGHIYKPTFDNFIKGHKCSYCNKNGIITLNMLKELIIKSKNIPLDISTFKNSKSKIKLKCKKGHIFETTWNYLNNGTKCPRCNGGMRIPYNEIKTGIEKFGYKLISDTYKNANTKIILECPLGHRFETIYSNFYQGHRCPKCNNSQSEQEVKDFIKSLNFKIIENDRKLISPLELDIVIPEKKIAIEYCGLYWHGELKGKDKKYHLHKLEECNKIGYRLITIFSDEWINKKEIVKSRLKHILNIDNNDRIYARKCVISEINSRHAKEFIDKYHIQGYTGSRIKLGAFYNNELVAIMTFAVGNISKGKQSEINTWELSRFCTSKNVIGIAGKLFEHFKKNYKWNNIFSYADRRWSDGNLYETIGFDLIYNTEPNYWYFNNELKRIHRFNFRKDKIKHLGNDKQTEWEIMQEQGYDRIWDCGNIKYQLNQ